MSGTADAQARRQAEVLGTGPRIAPLAPDQRSAVQQALIERMQPPPQLRGTAGGNDTEWAEILARHPDLFVAHMGFAQKFMADQSLSPRDRELVVLRLAWISGAPFEWGGHVTIGKACGIADDEIARIVEGSQAEGWTAFDRALLRSAEELHADTMIRDETWAVLAERLDERQLIELVMLVGHYKTVAYYQNALRFRLPPGNAGLLAR